MTAPLEVFCCYARKDQEMLDELKTHLAPLERPGQITIWSDHNINAGREWEKDLSNHLESAEIILLLISPNFMASDYCYSTEMNRAIARHNEGSAWVIPILLSPTLWQNAPFAKLQMAPTNAKPVTEWPNRGTAFHSITIQISQVVSTIQNQTITAHFTSQSEHDKAFLDIIRQMSQPPIPIQTTTHAEPVSTQVSQGGSAIQITTNTGPVFPQVSQDGSTTQTTQNSQKQLPRHPLPSRLKKWGVWIIPFLIILLTDGYVTSGLLSSLQQGTSRGATTTTPIGHQSIKLSDGENITIGISDGNYRFTTVKEKNDYHLPKEADGETCIYNENNVLRSLQPPAFYVTVVAVVSLSNTNTDIYSFGLGNATLQGFCQKQVSYNKDNKIKVRILIANVGVQDASVLQQTMPTITNQLILLSQQDKTFIGAIGFTFSASLDDHNDKYNIHTMDQLKQAGIPVISTAAATSTFKDKWVGYFYRMNPGDDVEASVAAYYAYVEQHKRKAFVFYDSTNPYSESLEEAFSDDFQTMGGSIQTENISNSNFTRPLLGLNNNPPDMIFCACVAASTSPDFTKLSQALQNYPHLKNGKVMLMGADGLYNPEGRNIAYKDMFFTALAFPDTISQYCMNNSIAQCTAEQMDFYKNYCQQFDPTMYDQQMQSPSESLTQKCPTYGLSRPSKSTMLAYDALSTLLWAYDHRLLSSSASLRDNVRQELSEVAFQGITGWIKLTNTSSNPVSKMIVVIFVDSNGKAHAADYCGEFTPAMINYHLSPQHTC